MSLSYETAQHAIGRMVRFQNEKGEWVIGKLVKVHKDGIEIQEVNPKNTEQGYGYGFFGPRPFWGPRFIPFAGVVGFGFFPFFW